MEKLDFQTALKNLGQQAKQEAEVKAAKEAERKKQQVEEVDFAKEMAGVTPLKNSQRYEPPRDLSPIKPRPKHADKFEDDNYFYVGDGQWVDVPDTFSKNGQGQNDIRRLQSGHWEVVADVDLHGYNQEEAQQVLSEFIEFVKKRGVCGEIIHGSGLGSSGYKPVLKNLVRRWLMAHPDVLAYAEPRKGNDGAVRILLKRQWNKESE
ncbi:Smr/MutS family protein [Neisseria weaveri]|uniref:Smr/MutS family protein n=1 Tax=Neisseria weaveri TaxID=28091 RepID=UPI000D31D586|nr:Smr/MutS family protein [Neisseria weaveri]